jgi:dipeptidyl aminopeptidase/acylaminoacyl peptidase
MMNRDEQSDRRAHRQFERLLSVYRELDEVQRRRIDAHVQGCQACARELAAFQAVDRQLAYLREHDSAQPQASLHIDRPDLAAFRSQLEAADRPVAKLRRLVAPLGQPSALAARVAGAVLLVAILGLFVSWIASLPQTAARPGQLTPETAAVATLEPTRAEATEEPDAPGLSRPPVDLGKVAYVQEGDIWLKQLPDGGLRLLADGGENRAPRWSPSGQWLAFLKDDILWVLSLNAPEEAYSLQTTAGGGSSGFAWSPVADRLAFTAGNELQLLEAANGAVSTLVSLPGDGEHMYRITHPFWKPDGAAIAYEQYRVPTAGSAQFQGSHGIWLLTLAEGEPAELYNSHIPEKGAAILAGWTSDGAYLLFWQGDILSASLLMDGVPLHALPISDPEKTGPVALSVTAAGEAPAPVLVRQDFLAPAPHSTEVAVTLGGGRDAWRNKRVGGAYPLTEIWRSYTPDGQVTIAPAWSPDGRQLAYVTMPGSAGTAQQALNARRIEVLVSGERRRLAGDPAYRDEKPLWSADGSHILFARVDQEERVSLWLVPVQGGEAQKVVEALSPPPPGTGWSGTYGYVAWDQYYDWWRGPVD